MEGIYEETFTNSPVEMACGLRLQIGLLEVCLHQVYNVTISSGQTIEVGNSTTAVANNYY